jgi:Divergent InlB B-repeat domain
MSVDRKCYCGSCYNFFEACDCIDSFDADGLLYPESEDDKSIDDDKGKDVLINKNKDNNIIPIIHTNYWTFIIPKDLAITTHNNLGTYGSNKLLSNNVNWVDTIPPTPGSLFLQIPKDSITRDPWDLEWKVPLKPDDLQSHLDQVALSLKNAQENFNSASKYGPVAANVGFLSGILQSYFHTYVGKELNEKIIDKLYSEIVSKWVPDISQAIVTYYQDKLPPGVDVTTIAAADVALGATGSAWTVALAYLIAQSDFGQFFMSLINTFGNSQGDDYFWYDSWLNNKNPTDHVYSNDWKNSYVPNVTSNWRDVYNSTLIPKPANDNVISDTPTGFTSRWDSVLAGWKQDDSVDRNGTKSLLSYDNPVVKKRDDTLDYFVFPPVYKVNLTSNLDTTGWLVKALGVTTIIPLGILATQKLDITINGKPSTLSSLLSLVPHNGNINVDIQVTNILPVLNSNNPNASIRYTQSSTDPTKYVMKADPLDGYDFHHWQKPDGTKLTPISTNPTWTRQTVDNTNYLFTAIYRPKLLLEIYIDNVLSNVLTPTNNVITPPQDFFNEFWKNSFELDINGFQLDDQTVSAFATFVTNHQNSNLNYEVSYLLPSTIYIYLSTAEFNLTITSNVPEALLISTVTKTDKNVFVVSAAQVSGYDFRQYVRLYDGNIISVPTQQIYNVTQDTVIDLQYQPLLSFDWDIVNVANDDPRFNPYDKWIDYELIGWNVSDGHMYNVSIQQWVLDDFIIDEWKMNDVVQTGNTYNGAIHVPTTIYFHLIPKTVLYTVTLQTPIGYPYLSSGVISGGNINGTSDIIVASGSLINCSIDPNLTQQTAYACFGYTVNGVYHSGATLTDFPIDTDTTIVADMDLWKGVKVQPSSNDINYMTWTFAPTPIAFVDDYNRFRQGTQPVITITVTNNGYKFAGWSIEPDLYDLNPRPIDIDNINIVKPSLKAKVFDTTYYDGVGIATNIARGRSIPENEMAFFIHGGQWSNYQYFTRHNVDGQNIAIYHGSMFAKNIENAPYCPLVFFIANYSAGLDLQLEPLASSKGDVGGEFSFTFEPTNSARDDNFQVGIRVGFDTTTPTWCTQFSNGSWDTSKETNYGAVRIFTGRGPHTCRWYLPSGLANSVYNKRMFVRFEQITEPVFMCFKGGVFLERPRTNPLIPSRFGLSMINTPVLTYVPPMSQFLRDHSFTSKYFMKVNYGTNIHGVQVRSVYAYPNWNNDTGMFFTGDYHSFSAIPTRGYGAIYNSCYSRSSQTPLGYFRTRLDNTDAGPDLQTYDPNSEYICSIQGPNTANVG